MYHGGLHGGTLTLQSLATTTNDLRDASSSPQPSRNPSQRSLFGISRVNKAKSTSYVAGMATVAAAHNPHERSFSDNLNLNTIPDPRSPSPHSMSARTPSPDAPHPDLSNEVATLSTKLINAINLQTTLDDNLQNARHELEAARERIARLEREAGEHQLLLESGTLVQRSESDRVQDTLRSEIREERFKRDSAEKQRRGLELELESLTSSLFEEANAMVSSARREHEEAEKRTEVLKGQLNEAEILLTSHQEQLQDLKAVLHEMQMEHDPPRASRPGTPVLGGGKRSMRMSNIIRRAAPAAPGIEPSNPLSFSHVLAPVVRTDLVVFDEFTVLLRASHKSSPPSRVHSGNYGGLNLAGVASTSQSNVSTTTSASAEQQSSFSSSSPRIPGSFNPSTPELQPVSHANQSSPTLTTNSVSLKDSKFYKRMLTEDIEPCLRLDTAPGLSWLQRRSVLSAMAAGALIVEPAPTSRFYNLSSPMFSCALCGEARNSEPHARRHRLRTTDSDEAQRHPLCDYCVARVRAAADFVAFLRHVRLGFWRIEGAEGSRDEARLAWEVCARLREAMFWARVGGGAVLVGAAADGVHGYEKEVVGESDGLGEGAEEVPEPVDLDARSAERAKVIEVKRVDTQEEEFEDARSDAVDDHAAKDAQQSETEQVT